MIIKPSRHLAPYAIKFGEDGGFNLERPVIVKEVTHTSASSKVGLFTRFAKDDIGTSHHIIIPTIDAFFGMVGELDVDSGIVFLNLLDTNVRIAG